MLRAVLDWFDTNPRLDVLTVRLHEEDAQSLLGALGQAVGAGAGRLSSTYIGEGDWDSVHPLGPW